MAKEKLSDKTEAVRLGPGDSEWLESFCAETGQNRSKPIRAAVRVLRMMLTEVDQRAWGRFTAKLSAPDDASLAEQKDELWAMMATLVMKGPGSGPSKRSKH